jgi:hypothetical protein
MFNFTVLKVKWFNTTLETILKKKYMILLKLILGNLQQMIEGREKPLRFVSRAQ